MGIDEPGREKPMLFSELFEAKTPIEFAQLFAQSITELPENESKIRLRGVVVVTPKDGGSQRALICGCGHAMSIGLLDEIVTCPECGSRQIIPRFPPAKAQGGDLTPM